MYVLSGHSSVASADPAPTIAENMLQLTDAAEATIQRQATIEVAPWISSWLADAPTLSAAFLQSQTNGGSDEVELALTLPLKSPGRARLDDELINNEQRLRASLLSYRRWYASGLVRDIVWTIQTEQTRQAILAEQLTVYQRFLTRLKALSSGRGTDVFHQYLYQQAATELELERLQSEKQLTNARQQLQYLTGQRSTPTDVNEAEFSQPDLQQHPRLHLLMMQEQQLKLQLQASTTANSAWQLTTRVKRVSTPGFDDNQIGAQLDVPLTFGRQTNQLEYNNFQTDYQQWLNSFSDTQLDIQQQYQTAQTELNSVKTRLALLKGNEPLRQQAKAALFMLLERQEISPDIAQQRLQQLLQAELQIALLEVQVQQAITTLNQTAGVIL
ncbi:TolC family protein [Arsukibacterium perlucidum]|uniref:TolC family protein n=1 Tax=Arsukibacterium perlucidum TaxID=368811 RepID=UPI00146AB562|nr:TolC family protein [Arsukibacterium perlucidum]